MGISKDLAGKVALVVGGSRGIGAAVVRQLAKDGADVAFTYASSPAAAASLVTETKTSGRGVLAIQADSARPDDVRSAVDQTSARFGRIDILVNNAGILKLGPVEQMAIEDFDRMVAVNVRGVFVAIQAVLPHMADGGRIITTGSVAADRAGFTGTSLYSMTKSALVGLTKGLARDLGQRGITVNVIQPGPTETDINDDDAMRAAIRPLMAIGRMGVPSEVASFVAYLAKPAASFITGSALTIDGGYLA